MALALALVASGLLARSAAAADTSCELAIIGGGPGGLYTAWRLAVDTKTVPAASICIFERAERVGGRTFSLYGQGTRKDLTVDLGAYRFCRSLNATDCDGCEMCMPMMSNLIKTRLGFKTEPYQPGDGAHDEACLVKIVDDEGENAGLASYTDAMYNATKAAGVRFFLTHEGTSVVAPLSPGYRGADGFTVNVRCTAPSWPVHEASPCSAAGQVTAKKVMLNTPLLPTLRIVRDSPSLKVHFEGGKFPAFLRVPHAWRHVKLYVHYDWAWWRTLGHTSGYFKLYGPTPGDGDGKWDGIPGCESPQGPLEMCSSDTLPLEGRYRECRTPPHPSKPPLTPRVCCGRSDQTTGTCAVTMGTPPVTTAAASSKRRTLPTVSTPRTSPSSSTTSRTPTRPSRTSTATPALTGRSFSPKFTSG